MDGIQVPVDGIAEIEAVVAQQIEAMLEDLAGLFEEVRRWGSGEFKKSGGRFRSCRQADFRREGAARIEALGDGLARAGADFIGTHTGQAGEDSINGDHEYFVVRKLSPPANSRSKQAEPQKLWLEVAPD